MARKKREIHCTVEITEGFEDRLTMALTDLYYRMKRNGTYDEFVKKVEAKKNGTA